MLFFYSFMLFYFLCLMGSVNEIIVHFVQHSPFLVSINIQILSIKKFARSQHALGLCIFLTRLIWRHNVGQSKSTFSNLIMLKTIASKSISFELLDKFQTLMTSSQVSQKTTVLNYKMLYINRMEILCGSLFAKRT